MALKQRMILNAARSWRLTRKCSMSLGKGFRMASQFLKLSLRRDTISYLKKVDQGSGQVADAELTVGGVGQRAVPPWRDEHADSQRRHGASNAFLR